MQASSLLISAGLMGAQGLTSPASLSEVRSVLETILYLTTHTSLGVNRIPHSLIVSSFTLPRFSPLRLTARLNAGWRSRLRVGGADENDLTGVLHQSSR